MKTIKNVQNSLQWQENWLMKCFKSLTHPSLGRQPHMKTILHDTTSHEDNLKRPTHGKMTYQEYDQT